MSDARLRDLERRLADASCSGWRAPRGVSRGGARGGALESRERPATIHALAFLATGLASARDPSPHEELRAANDVAVSALRMASGASAQELRWRLTGRLTTAIDTVGGDRVRVALRAALLHPGGEPPPVA